MVEEERSLQVSRFRSVRLSRFGRKVQRAGAQHFAAFLVLHPHPQLTTVEIASTIVLLSLHLTRQDLMHVLILLLVIVVVVQGARGT